MDTSKVQSTRDLDLNELLKMFRCSTANPKATISDSVLDKCLELFRRDYPDHLIISNDNGLLSSYYPSKMVVPQRGDGSETRLDSEMLNNLITRGRIARCRTRFPVPVILYQDRYICRSATLSGGPEIYGRTGLDFIFPNINSNNSEQISTSNASPSSASTSSTACDLDGKNATTTSVKSNELPIFDGSHVFSYARNQDINLLKYLSVGLICDLMVEKKKVKFGFYVTSSEKADKKSRYKEFGILCLPYPGCEFFQIMREVGYNLTGVKYNWNQQFVDAEVLIPAGKLPNNYDIQWEKYKSWDIIELTKNCLKMLLSCLKKNKESILIHCISGWDRTPLFISLLRLSLWADGQIHEKLTPREITYLTLAYDWYLFGHDLSDRISRGEEILFFCFYFLRYIEDSEFSIIDCENHSAELEMLLKDDDDQVSVFNKLETDSDVNLDNTPLSSKISSASSLCSNKSRDVTEVTSIGSIYDEKQLKYDKSFVMTGPSQQRTKPVEIPGPHPSSSKALRVDGNEYSPSLARSDSWQIVSPSDSIGEFSNVKTLTQNSLISQESTTSSPFFSISPSLSSSSSRNSSEYAKIPENNCKSKTISSNSTPHAAANASSSISFVSSNSPSFHKRRVLSLCQDRKNRLQEVRTIFFNAYSTTVLSHGNEVPKPILNYLTDHFTTSLVVTTATRVKAPN